MKTWKKVSISVGAALVLGGTVLVSIKQANKGVVTVQTAKVGREDLTSIVTASGEIRPKTYANVYGEGFGKITQIIVKEGDHVKRGDILLRLENIQPTADVDAQQAALASADAAVKSADASYRSAQADLAQRKADLERARLDWERAQGLYKDGLIPKSDYDARQAAFDGAAAAVDASSARLQQLRAEFERSRSLLEQSRALLSRTRDVLRKTTYTAPIDGVVTYIAVRVGENVVPGIQNSLGSYLMTISDMSVVTAEVKVDETDIVNVKNGQESDVTIDAIPGKIFKGHVTEVGTQAVLRTSGLATTQTTAGTQEAKDFKVIVNLDHPPDGLRPGLSTTSKVRTAHKKNVLVIPIQALAIRSRKDLEEAAKQASKDGGGSVTLAAARPTSTTESKKDEVQGVFVLRGKKVEFVEVETGILGVTDIEVSSGLKEGDQIVIGNYKALRTLRPGATVKVDNKRHYKEEAEKS
ncbi:MAG TPA: efflux RND transporter periplasmic adaptor subunit [Candidatus Acidoferrales bacterium]|nr:efflux RND transporter periplasmic adaptor subunit [Candidatus Acidoferrales bacterium]